ncbi:ankyrin repeat domain-containing protein [Sandaracinus amylolyticus]|uniref:ankyrin repeat domain-containing protein n=1 Tax=Sandaracinus amylolyticus TaxID=927083 RepID=UPI00094684C5|nr:ankyrin repeat domain-containing protein [Sandaracinus amylolyticus]
MALVGACEIPRTQLALAMLDAGADPNRVFRSSVSMTRRLLADEGQTPLRAAIASSRDTGDLTLIDALLAKGADPNAPGHAGLTPLHFACGRDARIEVVERLLAAGADPTIASEMGETPIDNMNAAVMDQTVRAAVLDMLREAAARRPNARVAPTVELRSSRGRNRELFGAREIRKLYWSSDLDWCVLAVRAAPEDVASAIELAARDASSPRGDAGLPAALHVLQMRGSSCSLAPIELGGIVPTGGWLDDLAAAISRRAGARVMAVYPALSLEWQQGRLIESVEALDSDGDASRTSLESLDRKLHDAGVDIPAMEFGEPARSRLIVRGVRKGDLKSTTVELSA